MSRQLEAVIANVPRPHVIEGPVAFCIYYRFNLPSEQPASVVAFSKLGWQIEKQGFDKALMRAVGLRNRGAIQHASILQRLDGWVRKLGVWRGGQEQLSEREVHQQLSDWLAQIEDTSVSIPLSELLREAKLQPDNAACHIALGAKFASQPDWEKAVQYYSEAIRLCPRFAELYQRRGSLQLGLGNSQAALSDFNAALELAPFMPSLYESRARFFAGLDAWRQAENDLNEAIRLAPRDPAIWMARSSIRLAMGNRPAAISDLQAALELDPHAGYAHVQLATIYKQAGVVDLNRSIEHSSRAIELLPCGIQPAFHVGGTRTVIASQWKVKDRATQTLMELFYRNLWQKNMTKLDTLREAQLTMLAQYDPQNGELTRGLRTTTLKIVGDRNTPISNERLSRVDPVLWGAI